jgi:hypothetical protein
MPRPSPFDDLSPDERDRVEREIIQRNFKDFDGLEVWLKDMGFEISRSCAYRHATKLKRRLQAVKDSTQAAKMIADAAPDDADLRSAAVISLVQTELFDVMVTLQEADMAEPAERVELLKSAAKSVLDMTKASVLQKQWQKTLEDKVAQAMARIEKECQKSMLIDNHSGRVMNALDQQTLEIIRREVYGIVA